MKRSLLAHYLTVAIRSLERYKTQSVISIVGLAVGFVCLALSSVWIRYENTFDNFHPGADRIYMVQDKGLGDMNSTYRVPITYAGLSIALRHEYPEVEAVTVCYFGSSYNEKFGYKLPARSVSADTEFMSMFSIPLLEGEVHADEQEAFGCTLLSDEYARRRFGAESAVGKPFNANFDDWLVEGVVKGLHHSCVAFDVLTLMPVIETVEEGQDYGVSQFVRLKKGINPRDFEAKLNAIDNETLRKGEIKLIPIHRANRYLKSVALHKDNLSLEHLRFFQLVSVLLVACVFINFLVLFLIRVRGRQREMALRMVHGAKPRMLLEQFVVELSLTLIMALGLGLVMTYVVKDVFAQYAGIDLAGGYILGSALLFMAIIAAVCLVVATVSVEIVRRNTIRRSLMPGGGRRNNTFTKVCTGVQLAMSLTLVCCAAFMLKQLYFMKNTDWGYDIKGHMHFELTGTRDPEHPDVPKMFGQLFYDDERAGIDRELMDRLRKLPYVHSVKRAGEDAIGLYSGTFGGKFGGTEDVKMLPHRDGETANDMSFDRIKEEGMPVVLISFNSDLTESGLTVVEGSLPIRPLDGEVAITERTRELMGVGSAVGMQISTTDFIYGDNPPEALHFTVKAVVKDLYLDSPTQAAQPYIIGLAPWTFLDSKIAVHYDPAHRAELKKELQAMLDEHPDLIFDVVWHEDEWAELMRSEDNLALLMTIVSIVAVLIAVFGVYSIITLACRQRRKEIALRKIHGAKLRDILGMFVREYGLILAVVAFVAFSVGYIIMHGWLEQYLKRTPLSWWVFAAIFAATAALIALSVGTRVWRTARENPADVVKSE
ncbi:MAG: ABC transporter permease [Bacteroidaceae bacterium]|nr:ABC transporter permease [Bacteroidaceae bacterium]